MKTNMNQIFDLLIFSAKKLKCWWASIQSNDYNPVLVLE